MKENHCFISYATADGLDFATKLADDLEAGYPFINAWFDKRDLIPGPDWDDQLPQAIKTCKCLLFVMTRDSVADGSGCKQEWTRALSYKKPIALLKLHTDIETPYRLDSRQWIDFSGNFEAGLAKLRKYVERLDSPEGALDDLKHRLADANRDLRRTRPEDQARIQAEIDELTAQIKRQEEIVRDPEAARKQTEANIQSGLERERQPEKPVTGKSATKFINPPPGIAPSYFQDRHAETKEIVRFLHDDAQRLLTVVGRGGVGKTAMVCRLLKHLENGDLPDDLSKTFGETKVDGIVYLSESGSQRVNFANIFAGLSKLLSAENAAALEALYKNPQVSSAKKMSALLDQFPAGRTLLLLDNLEPLIDVETFGIGDAELDESLRAFLGGAHSGVKIVLTTRIAPRALNLVEPGRQRKLPLDDGLETPYAENILREMDADGKLGLKTAPDALLARARKHTRGYPRALEALFAILSSDRYTTLEEILGISLPENVVQSLVGEAFSRLDGDAQKVMQALAVYNRPVSPAAVDYLLQPHLPGINSAATLNRLVTMQFVRRESGRYYLHPVDREYAFGIIAAEKPLTTKDTKSTKENQKASLAALPAYESLFKTSRSLSNIQFNEFTQHDLLHRAADYFAQARKPREEWKKLDDLGAQLAEFDLRCEAGDYDTAAGVVEQIDDLIQQWGHYRLTVQLNEPILDKLQDKNLQMFSINELGWAYSTLGDARKAMVFYQQGLEAARKAKNFGYEGAFLGSLGSVYANLGEARKAIEFYEQALGIAREIGDRRGEGTRLCNLGNAYVDLGEARKAIEFYEQALGIAREIGDRRGEGNDLGSLAACYEIIGKIETAIEYQEQSLAISKEIGDRNVEGSSLSILGSYQSHLNNSAQAKKYFEDSLEIARQTGYRYGEGFRLLNLATVEIEFGNYDKAVEFALQSIKIGDEISRPDLQSNNYSEISLAYLLSNNFLAARESIEQAQSFDVPKNNFNVSCLCGIIALRQGERAGAQAAFTQSIAQADEILAKTPDYYDALDAKGLALCGLALCAMDGGRLTADGGKIIADAIETFRAARRVAAHAGVVKRVLRLFDELAKCGSEGALAEVRKAAEGVE